MIFTFFWHRIPSIVPAMVIPIASSRRWLIRITAGRKHSHVPQFYRLIFWIWYQVACIVLRIDVRNAIQMTGKCTNIFWIGFIQTPTVPNLHERNCILKNIRICQADIANLIIELNSVRLGCSALICHAIIECSVTVERTLELWCNNFVWFQKNHTLIIPLSDPL